MLGDAQAIPHDTVLSPVIDIIIVDESGNEVDVAGETVTFSIPLPLNVTVPPDRVLSLTETRCGISTTTVACAWWDAPRMRWTQSGCQSKRVGAKIECTCTHLTEFALVVREKKQQQKPECQVPKSGIGHYVGAGLFVLLAAVATMQMVRLAFADRTRSRDVDRPQLLLRHVAVLVCALLRATVLVMRANQLSATVLVLLASVPYAIEFATLADLVWVFLQALLSMKTKLLARARPIYLLLAFLLCTLILASAACIVLKQDDPNVAVALSYGMASLILLACFVVCVTGLLLVKHLRTNARSNSKNSALDVKLSRVTFIVSVSLMLQSVGWVMSVQLAVLPQDPQIVALALGVDFAFYAMGLLVLGAYLWLKAAAVRYAVLGDEPRTRSGARARPSSASSSRSASRRASRSRAASRVPRGHRHGPSTSMMLKRMSYFSERDKSVSTGMRTGTGTDTEIDSARTSIREETPGDLQG